MSRPINFFCALAVVSLALAFGQSVQAQTAFGVNSNGTLFSFDVNSTGNVNVVGSLGIVPEGIDFRPGTQTLYALDVGPATTQLYTINVVTGVITPVGDGFPSEVTGQPSGNYSLLGATIGFDFNPRTLQADGSVRIRVVASTGSNLRLNSDTGEVAAVDTPLDYPAADPNAAATPSVDASAYINSARSTDAVAGTTTLYAMDFGTDDLATQNPPNAGQLNTVGPFGASVNADSGIGFDIVTDPASTDDGIGGDRAYAVLRRPDAPVGNEGVYLLYDVNLSTGQITGGRLVGGGEADFTGGFAVLGDLVAAGGLLISEFRFRGPQPGPSPTSPFNEFIELYNGSGSDIVVSAADGSEGFSVAASVLLAPQVSAPTASTRLFVIPNGTIIPARGHYLAVNTNGFSLTEYPTGSGGSVSFGDNTYTQDIGDAEGVAVFNTANTANYSTTTRLDAVGIQGAPPPPPVAPAPLVSDPLFAEGTPIPFAVTVANEHSYVRRLETGNPLDTNNNATDFVLVSTDPASLGGGSAAVLGAPGPESSQSPIQRNNLIKASLIDAACYETADPTLACGRTRYATGTKSQPLGTIRIRRRWTNNTGDPVTRLRFRVVDVTTVGSPNICGGCTQGAVTALTSDGETGLLISGGGTAATLGVTLEEPPAQPEGGGLNSTLSAGTVSTDTPLAPGDSINLNFLLGVEQTGLFRFFVNVEVLTEPELVEASPRPTKARVRRRDVRKR